MRSLKQRMRPMTNWKPKPRPMTSWEGVLSLTKKNSKCQRFQTKN
jgi:hypothetical protein